MKKQEPNKYELNNEKARYLTEIQGQAMSLQSHGYTPTVVVMSPKIAKLLSLSERDTTHGLLVRLWDHPEDKLELVVLPHLFHLLMLKRVAN